MSADSLFVWQQATEGHWVNSHPPAYIAATWLSSQTFGSPSGLVLIQSLFLAYAIVSVSLACVRAGASVRLVVPITVIVVLSPMVGAFSVSMWKDVPYAAAFLLVGARMIDLATARLSEDHDDESAAMRRIVWWSIVATVLRQNGILSAAGVLILLVVLLPGLRRVASVAVFACIGVLLFLRFVAYPIVGIRPLRRAVRSSSQLHDIAAIASRDPDALDPEDSALLEGVAPLDSWTNGFTSYSCRSANWQWNQDFNGWRDIDGQQRAFMNLWVELASETPLRSCATAFV